MLSPVIEKMNTPMPSTYDKICGDDGGREACDFKSATILMHAYILPSFGTYSRSSCSSSWAHDKNQGAWAEASLDSRAA